jgi:hypothetical protein
MRKLTALTVALTLFTAGQAFAGPPHAPAAHAPDEVKLEVRDTLHAKMEAKATTVKAVATQQQLAVQSTSVPNTHK